MTGNSMLAVALALSVIAVTACDRRASVPPDIDTPPPVSETKATPTPALTRLDKLGDLLREAKKTSGADSSEAAAKAGFEASATAIWAGYHNNALASDTQCKGRMIDVKGKIRAIGRDSSGGDYVDLGNDANESEVVRCYFASSEEPDLLTLSSGYFTIIAGICDGMVSPSMVRLHHSLVQFSSSPKWK